MRNYKQWTAEFRKQSLKYTNRAKKMGWIQNPKCCNRCGQTEGILHLHNEDYDATYYTLHEAFQRFPIQITKEEHKIINDALEEICWRCHMMHHSKHRRPQAVENYFKEIAAGKQYPPVYKHDFSILNQHK